MAGNRYSVVAMLLHWAIAIAVIVNWRIAESAEHLPDAERGAVMANHFALGMAILLLSLVRIGWRLIHKPPPLNPALKAWEAKLAKVMHAAFYVLLIGLPLLGWIGISGYDFAINMYGIVWPILPVGFGQETGHELLELHATLATIMLALVALHILGSIKHMVVDKDGNLWRMLPFGTPKG